MCARAPREAQILSILRFSPPSRAHIIRCGGVRPCIDRQWCGWRSSHAYRALLDLPELVVLALFALSGAFPLDRLTKWRQGMEGGQTHKLDLHETRKRAPKNCDIVVNLEHTLQRSRRQSRALQLS